MTADIVKALMDDALESRDVNWNREFNDIVHHGAAPLLVMNYAIDGHSWGMTINGVVIGDAAAVLAALMRMDLFKCTTAIGPLVALTRLAVRMQEIQNVAIRNCQSPNAEGASG